MYIQQSQGDSCSVWSWTGSEWLGTTDGVGISYPRFPSPCQPALRRPLWLHFFPPSLCSLVELGTALLVSWNWRGDWELGWSRRAHSCMLQLCAASRTPRAALRSTRPATSSEFAPPPSFRLLVPPEECGGDWRSTRTGSCGARAGACARRTRRWSAGTWAA